MHKDNLNFQNKLIVDKSALGITSIETVQLSRPTQRDINNAVKLPEPVKQTPAPKWWERFLFPRVIETGNYQRKREVFGSFGREVLN